MRIPDKGLSKDEIFRRLEAFRADDVSWRSGRTWAYVYDPGREAEEVIKQAYGMYLSENALDPTAFPSMLRLETSLVAMAAAHLNGTPGVVGNFTSGGTESIILAVKTARDHARALRPQITAPEIILPVTAHAAFHKACHYLDVRPVLVPVDTTTFKADVDAVRRAITPNTILLVGSAVSYAHGVVDPVSAIASAASARGIPCHVDGCIGGWFLAWYRRLGYAVPDWDFAVDGVTSISVDLHKYAYASKGASTLLFRDPALRRASYFASADWPGYAMINTTMQSTKSAGPLAAAWAAFQHVGADGYAELAQRTYDATRALVERIGAILAPPEAAVGPVEQDAARAREQGSHDLRIRCRIERMGGQIPPP